MKIPRGRLLLILLGLGGTLAMSLWLMRELTRPGPGPVPRPAPPTAEGLVATPTRATQARARARFAGKTPADLALDVVLPGGRAHQTVQPAASGDFTLSGLEPGDEYHLALRSCDQPVPGGRATYRHPRAAAVAYSEFVPGEDYLRVHLQTWVPHDFRVVLEDVEAGAVEAKHETTGTSRRLWHVFPGLEPAHEYQVTVSLRDSGHFLPLEKKTLRTRESSFRTKVEESIQKLNMPIMQFVGVRELWDYSDHKSVSRIVEALRSEAVRAPVNYEIYRALVLLVGWVGAPGARDVLRAEVESGPTPEHVYQALVAYANLGPEADYAVISSTMRRHFRAEGADSWSPWSHNSQCAEALVQVDRVRAADESLGTTLEVATRSLGERLVACLVLAQGMSPKAAMGLAQLVRRDPDARLRRLAAGHLSRLGDPGRDELRRLLTDVEDASLRARLLYALGAAGNAEDVERVLPFLSPKAAREERLAAVLALGLLPDASAASRPLLEVLARDEPGMAPFVLWTLGQLGPVAAEALPALGEKAKAGAPTRGMLPLALARIGGARVRQILEEMEVRPGNETEVTLDRAHALFGLGLIGEAAARPRLEAASKDAARPLYERGLAMQGLGMLGDSAAAPILLDTARDPREPELLRLLALKCWALLDAPRRADTLKEIAARAQDSDPIGALARQLPRDVTDGLRRAHTRILPAFLPYLNTRLRVRTGEGFHSLRHGLWASAPDLARVVDDRGSSMGHLYQARMMALLVTAGRQRYRDAVQGLERFVDIEDGTLFLLPNHPPAGKDEAQTFIPHFQPVEDAIGFMVVHLKEAFD